jgi:adenylate cyclase
MDAWLEQEDGARVALADGFSIGRGADNQLPLQDDRASRRHALIHDRGNEGFWLVDLGSRNGTFCNGRRVQQPSRLQDGDSIQVGASRFTFRQPGAAPQVPASQRTSELTVLEVRFEDCWLLIGDLIGSTQFVQKADPGQAATLTTEWLRQCQKLIESYGGSVNKFLGDGFFAFWKAAENISEKLGPCLDSLRKMQTAEAPQFRLVLHRARVQVGGGASLGEDNLFGPEVNFAFRMEKLAGNLGEEFLLSEAAATQCGKLWPLEDAGSHTLPGFDSPFRFFRFVSAPDVGLMLSPDPIK